jgi:heavy metal sensor kinase
VSVPIRVRLTAWYVLVLAAVIAALGAFVVTRLRSDLTSELDGSLRSGAAQIAQGYAAEGVTDFRDVANTVLPGPGDHGAGAQVLQPGRGVVFSVGDPVTRTPLLGAAALSRAVAGDRAVTSVDRGTPSRHFRMIAMPVQRLGQRQALVVVESLGAVDRATHRVLVLLLLGSAGALGLIALGGWWIARKALRPVGQMATRADRIGIQDLSDRIAVPRVRDEVGHLARTLNAMLARLEEGVEARQRLVADASHELRAPLAAMRSELEVSLRHDTLSDQARAVLASTRDEVVRMGRTVDNLLTLARVDEGRLELLLREHDLREVAEAVARTQRATAELAGVDLVVEGDAGSAAVDRDRVEQVMSNLVDNAIRFAPPGSEVRLSLWRNATEAGVRVSDDGPGVPADAHERIFERFAHQDPARARSGGAGLGLAICREIVRAHGGRIWIEDRRPHGSEFVVALPLTHVAPRREPDAQETTESAMAPGVQSPL